MTTVNGVSTEEAIANNIRSYPSFPIRIRTPRKKRYIVYPRAQAEEGELLGGNANANRLSNGSST